MTPDSDRTRSFHSSPVATPGVSRDESGDNRGHKPDSRLTVEGERLYSEFSSFSPEGFLSLRTTEEPPPSVTDGADDTGETCVGCWGFPEVPAGTTGVVDCGGHASKRRRRRRTERQGSRRRNTLIEGNQL